MLKIKNFIYILISSFTIGGAAFVFSKQAHASLSSIYAQPQISYTSHKYALINVIDIERGEKKVIKVTIDSKAIDVGSIAISAATCRQEHYDFTALPDARAFIRIHPHGASNPIFRGWVSKKYSHGISSGRLIFTLHSCTSY